MHSKLLTCWSFICIGLFVFADSQDFIHVNVLNRNHVVLRIFKNSDDLNGFQKIWVDKSHLKGLSNIGSWDYLLDIQTKVTSIQWCYDSKTGLCTPFGKKKRPLYHIRDYELLNKAIHALPHQKISWVVEDEPLDLRHEPWIPPYDPREGRRKSREFRDEGNYRESEARNKPSLPVFNPSLASESDKEGKWEDDSRPVYISLKEARRRRDESRTKAEAATKIDSRNLPGIPDTVKE